ncbi:MAG: hypothetical protein AAGE52_02580 [Myxococcota bacterium]
MTLPPRIEETLSAAVERFALTARQTCIVHLTLLSKTRRQIIRRLDIAPSTYDTHVRAIFRKTGMRLPQFALAIARDAATLP